jgi:hypothetical protein
MRLARMALGRFAFGWSRFGSFAGSRPRGWSGRSVWVFLARGGFAPKAPLLSVRFPWISLDFLVRIKTFQWVTLLQAGKLFSQPFSPAFAAPGREPVVEAMRSAGSFIGQVPWFLIFCKRVSFEPFPFGPPQSKSRSLLYPSRERVGGLANDG